jgi:hypothetical protein
MGNHPRHGSNMRILNNRSRTPLGLLMVEPDPGGGGPAPTPTPPAAPAPTPDKGYPDGTPIDDMTPPQQAAYWKAQSRRHEDRSKSFGNLTPDDLTALREKAARADALDHELSSEADKAVKAARDEESAKAIPRVVRAEFKAAAKGVLTAEQLTALLEDRDLSKYADAKGDPDEDKIANLVKAFAPPAVNPRRGPGATGLGNLTPPSVNPGDQGRAMAAKRFGTPAKTS